MVTVNNSDESIQTLNITKEISIAAPIEIAFEALLAEMGPESQMPDGTPFPLKLEPWPGGRWFRDLGKTAGLEGSAGHFWGHVQVIKPPKLIEICGPMFMSFPAISHVQYRLTVEGNATRVKITHGAMGQLPAEFRENVHQGWEYGLKRIQEIAERMLRAKS